jgi:hypothetical protein
VRRRKDCCGSPAALLAVVGDLRHAKPDPRAESGIEAMALRQPAERLRGFPADQAEGARVVLDQRHVRQLAEHAVKQVHSRASNPGLLPRAADGEHHLGAVAPLFDQFRNKFRRILQVGVHRDDRVGVGGVRDAGGQRRLEAKVAGELDDLEPRILLLLGQEQFRRAVLAAVVDQHGAPLHPRVFFEQRRQPGECLRQHGFLIEHRHDDGDGGRGMGHGSSFAGCGERRE